METKLKLKEVYSKILREEKKAREYIEKLIRTNIEANPNAP